MISTIILTWNSEKYIKKCIESVIESAVFAQEKIEILIFDNGSKDQTPVIIKDLIKIHPFIQLTRFEQNRGTTYPRNLGIKNSEGDYILILDSDVELEKDTIKELLRVFKDRKNVGIVCPKLILENGELQYSFKKFPTLQTKLLKIFSSKIKFLQNLSCKDELYEEKRDLFYPDYCISACWLLRREVFNKVGFFDENIFYSPEDVDFCLRVWLSGYKVVYFPKVRAIHYTQRVSYVNKQIAKKHIEGLLYYFKKYKYLFSRKKIYKKISKAIGGPYPIK